MSFRLPHRSHPVACSIVTSILAVLAVSGNWVFADPHLRVSQLEPTADGDLQWLVEVKPDTSFFTNAEGSLSAEFGFEFSGSRLLRTVVNEAVWAFELPGFNPFTESITVGFAASETQAFVSIGSEPIADVVELLTFTTEGTGTTVISWGGYEVLPDQPGGFIGGRLSQAGINFDGISGSLSSGGAFDCDPNSRGDLDGSGTVEFADFLTLSRNFGEQVLLHTDGDIDCNGTVEFADFLVLSGNFGQTVNAAETVPEPGLRSIALLAGMAVLPCFRKRRAV